LKKVREIHVAVKCAHNPSHALAFCAEILKQSENALHYPEACFVEAGCFKGGSSAKFSLFTACLERDLILFDSFEGLPTNQEEHRTSIEGHSIEGWFEGGNFCGSLEEVQKNISQFGKKEKVQFVPGWFDKTLPDFSRPILGAFLDVDLASSTEICLRHFYPLLVPGGVIVSQDGDFPLVIEVIKDSSKWRGKSDTCPPPIVEDLGNKITKIRKPSSLS
ncbi:MAG: TylF/MycF family methyltransferase, partial [Holosporales bacterium]|nr:TylF/MycF family methyltransferase [Holosporales bacterium]